MTNRCIFRVYSLSRTSWKNSAAQYKKIDKKYEKKFLGYAQILNKRPSFAKDWNTIGEAFRINSLLLERARSVCRTYRTRWRVHDSWTMVSNPHLYLRTSLPVHHDLTIAFFFNFPCTQCVKARRLIWKKNSASPGQSHFFKHVLLFFSLTVGKKIAIVLCSDVQCNQVGIHVGRRKNY